ncbi:acyltransferase family protein [Sinomonas soli]
MLAVNDARANNFNVMRLIAASGVIFSHASDIALGRPDALAESMGYSGGWIAVTAFFAISGMLIYRSMVKSQSVRDYLIARSLRIFPGLWVMLIISVVILGLLFSSHLSDYFLSGQVRDYLLGNGVLYRPEYFLPGLFENNALPGVVNGSLWTLRFEFTCYLAVLALFLLKGFQSERNFLIALSAYAVGYCAFLVVSGFQGNLEGALSDGSDMAKLHRLSLAFVLGMIAGRYSGRIRIRGWMVAVMALASWASFGTVVFSTLLIASVALAVFWAAFWQAPFLVPMRRMHDYSYGVYIYAFPVQQCVAHLLPGLTALGNAVVSLAFTLPLAAGSWYLVERPALRFRTSLATKRVQP